MPHSEKLAELFQLCFPFKRAEEEIKALGPNSISDVEGSSFIIYNILSIDEADIIDIGTAPDDRNKGHARKLLEKTIDSLKKQDIKTVYLDVAENNEAALSLYKSMGFVQYNSRKDYYKSDTGPINAILMKKSI